MTLLITSIAPKNLAELKSRAQRAWAGGAGAVELRLDVYDEDPTVLARYLADHRDRTWIATCRSVNEGGQSSADPLERAEFLIAATRESGALIDFEYADWQCFETAREVLSRASASKTGEGPHLVLSAHDFTGPPENIRETASAIRESQPATAAKIAYGVRDIRDSFAALDLMHEHGAGVIAIALGEAGAWSRVLAKKLAAFGAYCSLDATSATAPGQLALDEMIHRYRWPQVTGSTKVYGVIGDPVAHSLSPMVFNRWFTDEGIDAVYLPLPVRHEAGCLEGFLDGCTQRPWLDIGGFSVTLPHKQTALRWVGNGADASAVAVGALNTLVMGKGKIEGFNTDAPAAAASLEAALACGPRELVGLPVDVLGTGGVSRAVLAGLRNARCRVTVYGRSVEKTAATATDFAATPAKWKDRLNRSGEVLINCTPIGMWPVIEGSPMTPESISGCALVFDVIYNPLETRLIREGRAVGCQVLGGLDMFVRQAATQFERWTSKTPDLQAARRIITDGLARRNGGRL